MHPLVIMALFTRCLSHGLAPALTTKRVIQVIDMLLPAVEDVGIPKHALHRHSVPR